MNTPARDATAPRSTSRRTASLLLLCISLAAVWVAALAAPGAADAHVRKDKQGLYVLGVDGWRRVAHGAVADADGHADTLTNMANGMSEVIPPENAAEQALLDTYKKSAGDWQDLEADYAVKMVPAVEKNLNRWEKKVKPWFRKASDKRALENALDAYMKGFTHLVHQSHGELLDAAADLKAEDLAKARDHIALAIGRAAFAEQEMKDAVAALSALLN
jgi:hypothetical protein